MATVRSKQEQLAIALDRLTDDFNAKVRADPSYKITEDTVLHVSLLTDVAARCTNVYLILDRTGPVLTGRFVSNGMLKCKHQIPAGVFGAPKTIKTAHSDVKLHISVAGLTPEQRSLLI